MQGCRALSEAELIQVPQASTGLGALRKKALWAWLAHWQGRTLPPSQVLFPSRKGTNRPITWEHANASLQQAFRARGLTGPLGPHSMRKTFAPRFYQQSGATC